MLLKSEAQERVARGAAHLDGLMPDWFRKVDVKTLKLYSDRHCLLAQVTTGDYWQGAQHFGLTREMAGACGFNVTLPEETGGLNCDIHALQKEFDLLQACWIEAIAARLHPESDSQPDLVGVADPGGQDG
jgi:hypothetical protein